MHKVASCITLLLGLSACSSDWLTAQIERPGLRLRADLSTEPLASASPRPSPSATLNPAATVQVGRDVNITASNIQQGSGSNLCIGVNCKIEETNITQIQPILSPNPQPSASDILPTPTASQAPTNPVPTATPSLIPEVPFIPTPTPEPTPPTQETGPVNIAAFVQSGWTPEIIADGPHIGILTTPSSGAILYRSDNYGQSFAPIPLHMTLSSGSNHLVRQSNGAWLLLYVDTDGRLYMRRSSNQGLAWGAPIRIGEGFNGRSYLDPTLTFANGQGYLVVNAMVGSTRDLYLFKIDSALNITPPSRITADTDNNEKPQVAVTTDGKVHVSYVLNSSPAQLMLITSDNDGESFHLPERIDDANTTPETPQLFSSFAESNTMVADGKRLYIGYGLYEQGDANLYLAWRPDSETAFQRTLMHDVTAQAQLRPLLKVDAQRNLYAMWVDDRMRKNYGTQAWAISTNGGQSFAPARLLNEDGYYRQGSFALNPADPGWLYMTTNYNNDSHGVSEVRFFRRQF